MRHAPALRPGDERDQEADREHVGERDGAGEVPVHLLERHAEDAREEQEARDAPHPTTCSSRRASSSERVRRDTLRRHSSENGAPSSVPARHFACRSRSAAVIPATSSGATTTPAPASRISSAAAPSGGTTARIGRSAARYSNTFPREHALAPAARVGDQQEQRLRVALQLERPAARRVRDQLEPVAERARLRPLPVGGAEVAEEADDHVVEARLLERGQERPRVALAEERAGVREAEAIATGGARAGEVVEVGAVRDRHDVPARRALAELVGDRVGDAR